MNRMMRRFLRSCNLYDAVVDVKHYIAGTEREYATFYSKFVSKGDLCFDIGANVGRRTQVLLRLGTTVVAVEPQDHCMDRLKRRFKNKDGVVLVKKAMGAQQGHAEMMICDSHSLSSISKNWVSSVQASGRYSVCSWDKTITVPMVTLDSLISEYGKPTFAKIDVEGYEDEVFKGLTQPINTICFEFTPEYIHSAINSVTHLSELGDVRFNYCLEHSPTEFGLTEWAESKQMSEMFTTLAQQKQPGDIYCRFSTP
jgi:FkbM family methyltransferase